jgi:hypothetical protein
MAAPYREAACTGCGASAVRADVGLCEPCLRDTASRAKRILESATALGGGQATLRVSRLVLAASCAVLVVVSYGALRYSRSLQAHERLLEARASALEARSGRASEAPPRPQAPAAAPLEARDQAEPLPWPPHLLSTSGPPTHDPEALLERARRLARAGVDLPVVEVVLPTPEVPVRNFMIQPFSYRGAGVIGVRLVHWAPEADTRGLEAGDVITAVDGWPVDRESDEWARPFLAQAGTAVIELYRGRRRLVLALRWQS